MSNLFLLFTSQPYGITRETQIAICSQIQEIKTTTTCQICFCFLHHNHMELYKEYLDIQLSFDIPIQNNNNILNLLFSFYVTTLIRIQHHRETKNIQLEHHLSFNIRSQNNNNASHPDLNLVFSFFIHQSYDLA